MMTERWIADAIQPYRTNMSFLDFYEKLKACLEDLSNQTIVSPEQVHLCVDQHFCIEPMDTQDLGWSDKSTNTYSPISHKGHGEFCSYFPLSTINKKKGSLYKACLGYAPKLGQLPKNIDIARAFAMGEAPPNLPSKNLWRYFGIQHRITSNNIVISTVVQGMQGVREYYVCNSNGLISFCEKHDKSASEVFSSKLWCTAITFDIDGKTMDAKLYGANNIYPITSIIEELKRAMVNELHQLTNGRWDTQLHPPACHTWRPADDNSEKLSLRISFHLPQNIAFKTISDVSTFVKKVCDNLKSSRSRILCLYSVTVDGLRFEKSNRGDEEWISINDEGNEICMSDYINQNKCTTIETSKGPVKFNHTNAMLYVLMPGQERHTSVTNVKNWIRDHLDKVCAVECLVDTGVYHNNGSLRLPTQSKIVNGKLVRKFCPMSDSSTVLDALVHYPHTDTNAIEGDPMLLSYSQHEEYKLEGFADHDLDKAKLYIENKYDMNVVKVTERHGKIFLDVQHKNGTNYCLIKGDIHSSARMYFILTGNNLSIGCWSDKCKVKGKQNVDRIKLQ